MLKLFESSFSHFKNNFLYIILRSDALNISLNVKGEETKTIEKNISDRILGEETYLQSIASVLREELSWLDIDKNNYFAILLDKSILDEESFVLPSMPDKEEKEAIAWEISESVRLERETYYSAVEKNKKSTEREFHYTVYAVEKSFINKLAGMIQGFGYKLSFIAPYDDNKTFEEMSSNNLLPEELGANEVREILTKWGKYFACASLAVLLLTVACLELLVYNAKVELKNVEEDLASQASWQESFKVTSAMERKNRKLNTIIKRLDDTTTKHSKVLEALGRSTVSGMWITSVEAEGLNYKITGRSVDMLGLNAWLDELGASSDFKYSQVLSTEERALGISFNVIIGEKKVM